VALDTVMTAAAAWRSRVVMHEQQLWTNSGWDVMAPENRTSTLSSSGPSTTTDRILSTSTGGLSMSPVSGDSFFKRLAREQGGSYILAFEPLDADRDGRAHEIKVKVTRADTTIRARHQFLLDRAHPAGDGAGSR
jgi:predicted flavoprotein YhiN